MSLHFETLTIEAIHHETPDCVSIQFAVPENLKEKFQFTQGQYLSLRKTINGQEYRRSYSICNGLNEDGLCIAIKRMQGGVFSNYANDFFKVNDKLEVMPPMGKFHTILSATQQKNYTAFVAGSGITPILSIIKTTLFTEHQSNFTLVYANKNRQSIIFKEQLEALKNQYMDRFQLIHILSREKTDAPIHFGRIDAAKCIALSHTLIDLKKTDEFFICGPEEMIFTVKEQLTQLGVAANKIHFELFHAPGGKSLTQQMNGKTTGQGLSSSISLTADGITIQFKADYNGVSILDAALASGADLPFACKGGVCCTCKAKLLEGTVDMDRNFGLEQDEINNGYILTCQAHPTSDKLVIDFDTKQ